MTTLRALLRSGAVSSLLVCAPVLAQAAEDPFAGRNHTDPPRVPDGGGKGYYTYVSCLMDNSVVTDIPEADDERRALWLSIREDCADARAEGAAQMQAGIAHEGFWADEANRVRGIDWYFNAAEMRIGGAILASSEMEAMFRALAQCATAQNQSAKCVDDVAAGYADAGVPQ